MWKPLITKWGDTWVRYQISFRMMSKETKDLGVFSEDEQICSFGVPDLATDLLSKETHHSFASSEDKTTLGQETSLFLVFVQNKVLKLLLLTLLLYFFSPTITNKKWNR